MHFAPFSANIPRSGMILGRFTKSAASAPLVPVNLQEGRAQNNAEPRYAGVAVCFFGEREKEELQIYSWNKAFEVNNCYI